MQAGLYDELITLSRRAAIELGDSRLTESVEVDPEDSHLLVAKFLEHAIAGVLARYRGKDSSERQRLLVDRIIELIGDEVDEGQIDHLRLDSPLRRLIAVRRSIAEVERFSVSRPDTPLSQSALLTGTRLDPSLGSQLCKEIVTADRVDILCSFIKWSGLRIILESLRELTGRSGDDVGIRLRVITTSYMGATDPKAIEVIAALPRTAVRVSYDTERTRLHAKAYLIHRETGFSSGYVGSANLSRPALSEGLEWTTKISRYELPHLWEKVAGTFETYWQDDEFELFDLSQPTQLRSAIARERSGGDHGSVPIALFDLRPYPFQEEILDVLSSRRAVRDHHRHLVIAATGTGKTMIAAFDYARISRATGTKPTLIFVAHREEILRQALATFRGVLKDQNFGELLVAGETPISEQHLFCSIQSYNSRRLYDRPRDAFSYVIVDEFHHAAATSYRKLLDHVAPTELLGLTATPERGDGLDVLQYFDDAPTAEIRLPDAIDRRLLSPFQYFGVADSVDLDGLTWHRGGYKTEDLDRVYTGNDVRAGLVIDKLQELLLDPMLARGIGFCVSKAHANFMARFFSDRGLPATALTADSPADERRTVRDRLVRREINFVFVIDLYNEGVDIPEVDTVLFLRPTESLTVYLQQLGRGLRLSDEKETLTVLDFIGAQSREFRFANRFRALSTRPTNSVEREIAHDFPHLPSGCTIQLEKVARQRIIENVRQSIRLNRPRVVNELRTLGRVLDREPTLKEAIGYLETDLESLTKRAPWSRLMHEAGFRQRNEDPNSDVLAKGLQRLCFANDLRRIDAWTRLLLGNASSEQSLYATMFLLLMWGNDPAGDNFETAIDTLRRNPSTIADALEVLSYLADKATIDVLIGETGIGPLQIGGNYLSAEILGALGHWSLDNRPSMREGTLHLPDKRLDVSFITLQKTKADYSPTTMYEDYFISQELFHWQSQSRTSIESATGQRYINHKNQGYTPVLFVRETRKTPAGNTSPYYYLGPCDYVSHQGSRPISITWRLRNRVSMPVYRKLNQQIAG